MNRKVILIALVAVLAFASLASAAGEGSVPFRFAILSDRTEGHTPGVWQKVIEAIKTEKPDFVVTVGDHIEGYGEDYERVEAEWDSVLAILRTVGVPVYMTPGNHDIWDDRAQEIYTEKTGRKPFYSFDYANSHFVILDDSRIESWSSMGLSQVSWLMRDLAEADAQNVFVFFHKPLWDQTLRHGKPDNLHEVLVNNGVDAVFCGHYHRYFCGDFGGIEYNTIGSSGADMGATDTQPELRGEFFQYGIVDVTKDGFKLTIHDLDGNVYPREFVTVGLLDEIDRIENDLIRVSPLVVTSEGGASSEISVSIENDTAEPLGGDADWSVPDQWRVEPAAAPFSVAPGSVEKLTFTASKTDGIYPAPVVSLKYPLADGRMLEVERPARILRKVEAPAVASGPTLDGKPDAAMMDGGALVTELYTGQGYQPVDGKTEFAFAHDAGNLIVTAVCFDDKMGELRSEAAERDAAVYMDDCVGFFLQPDPDELVVYQLYVNPDGVVFDQKITFDETMWYTVHPDWNGDYEIATSRGSDRWTAELVIPYETLGYSEEAGEPVPPSFKTLDGNAPKPEVAVGKYWRLNFRRKQARTSGSADWQVPIDYDPRTFGELDLR